MKSRESKIARAREVLERNLAVKPEDRADLDQWFQKVLEDEADE